MPGISGRNPGMGLQTLSVQIIPWFIFNHTHHGMNPEPTVLKNEFVDWCGRFNRLVFAEKWSIWFMAGKLVDS